jgi:beta-phosphoglucomutase-like phosphatase (HAD superfamily)
MEVQKIKLIVFDLDGVLVDSRELHYEALNRALASIDPKYVQITMKGG